MSMQIEKTPYSKDSMDTTKTKGAPARIFLIDGTAMAYRAFFAFIKNPLVNSRGLQTGAIFGYTQSLISILDQEKPDYIAVAFDSKEPTFRHKLYDEYKATREKMPDEMADQLPFIQKVTEAFNIPFIKVPSIEADDIIGSLAKKASQSGMSTYIVSSDKDFMQLVDEQVVLFQPGKRDTPPKVTDIEKVHEKFSVRPDQIIDLLSLMGDSSDNIPGVAGVGPKTASTLLKEHDTLENILAQAEAGKLSSQKLSEKIVANKDNALLSKQLVTIACDQAQDVTLESLATPTWDFDALIDLFRELEFQTLEKQTLKRKQSLHEDSGADFESASSKAAQKGSTSGDLFPDTLDQADKAPNKKSNYHCLSKSSEVDALCDQIEETGSFAFDVETTGLQFFSSDLVGLSIACKPFEAYYLHLIDQPELMTERLRGLFSNRDIAKGGHNIKFDILALRKAGIPVNGVRFDSMLESYLLNSHLRRHGLDLLAAQELAHTTTSIESLIGKGKKQITMVEVPLEQLYPYACEDADVALRLHQAFIEKISDRELLKLYEDVEMKLIPVLADMEYEGIRLDVEALQSLSELLEKRIFELTESIYSAVGDRFNINSPKQLGEILFNKMELHKEAGIRPKKTKTGFSTDVSVLESLRPHPLAEAILEFRNVSKLKSTYADTLPTLVEPSSQTVHTSFNQAVAATGRLSSSDPNLQNIPIRTDLGKEIRRAFVSKFTDGVLLSADYSQIELRMLAHLSLDESLIEFFENDLDIHEQTARRIFKVSSDKELQEYRSKAKAINFGILYGMGPKRLAKETGVSMEEAQDFIESYFEAFPKVSSFIESTVQSARDLGFVSTILGRKRSLPDIDSNNPRMRAEAERVAVNTPIQGSSADVIKLAMLELHERIQNQNLKSRLILQVHDELVVDVVAEELEDVRKLLLESMQGTTDTKSLVGALKLRVPLKVEVGFGSHWLAAHG